MNRIDKLKCKVMKVKYANPDNGWCVFTFCPAQSDFPKRDQHTATGVMGSIGEGDVLLLTGHFEDKPQFGRQLVVEAFELEDPTQSGMLAFLTGGFLHGVGESLGKKIFKKFGEKAAEILDQNPKQLLEVSGVGEKKLADIIDSWNQHRGKREALSFFGQWGLGPATIHKIFERWPNPRDAIQAVEENPYLLAWEIHGVGFRKADEIAFRIGFQATSACRVQAAVAYTLDEAAKNEGHCFLERDELTSRVVKFLCPEQPDGHSPDPELLKLIEDNIQALIFANKAVEEEDRLYLRPVYQAETRLAEQLKRLQFLTIPTPGKVATKIKDFERDNRIELHEQQAKSVTSSITNKVSIITGGPGTGKTTIIRCLLHLCKLEGIQNIKLVAPTGKAAKRLAESTGQGASTIHRLLEFQPGSGFTYGPDNRLKCSMLICDEASMLDVFLARSLVQALPDTARLVLVGDVHQLPSVGAGNVLKDMIGSGRIPTVELTHVYRQSEGSYISLNARAILEGKTKEINLSNQTDDFFWIGVPMKHKEDDGTERELTTHERALRIQGMVIKSVQRLLQKEWAPSDIMVLSPTRKGQVGVQEMNKLLQMLLNPRGADIRVGFRNFRVGDRVMQLRNNYDKDVFNGDQGIIVAWDEDKRVATINFDGQRLEYEAKDMDELDLAYAMTVHKSQGSESPCVIMPVTTCQYVMLQRNLLYTGVTRAKQFCVLIGESKALGIAVRNNRVTQRKTRLAIRLR